ncbi:GAF domain-containing protein [Nonlabens mediterrranea]|uniref:GAF domain-containing protein n=1 Tax=Nonlabens mediterrranea TaxID=1419947 RepID=A0ABS0A671_9FLAO|nr:GAF domain-containing protein [Nonlabens mediterrranea]
MDKLPEDFMMEVTLSFHKVIEHYRERLTTETNPIAIAFLNATLEYVDKHPRLESGLKMEEIKVEQEAISTLLSDLFPRALTLNEIKAATVPFSDFLFNKTERFENILSHADGKEFSLLSNTDFDYFTMASGLILQTIYGANVDLSKPLHCQLPDQKGYLRTYRITYIADFVEVALKDEKYRLSDKCIKELLRNPDDKELWKSKFPKNSYTFKGFGIISLTDVTMDNAISDLKTVLLGNLGEKSNHETEKVENIFKQMFNMDDLQVGFTVYNNIDNLFESMVYSDSNSYLLGASHEKNCMNALCRESYKHLLEDFTALIITDVKNYRKTLENTFIADNLISAGINSAIFYPISHEGRLLGILELASPSKYVLNAFNARKLEDVTDYLKMALIRSEQEYETTIKALIQTECTSIHPSVQWKFEQEARRLIRARAESSDDSFRDLVFEDVSPLYGQIDVVGSSDARNEAIKIDLISQLELVSEIFAFAKANEPLPIYDQIIHRINKFQEELEFNSINANTEREIIGILEGEINPFMDHVKDLSNKLKQLVTDYENTLNPESGVIFTNRDNYDTTVQVVNERLARFLDRKQKEAQEIYPHFFERYKTDGVEHNIYVGSSIVRGQAYNPVYLYNLRLWQLQTMIQMENKFYQYQESLPVQLEAASMILVFGNTLGIRYRIDEKRFDVDGAYNARYEVVKKRIDKANIKGTQERITQKGKISIIYTNHESELEYLRYISFLQDQKYLNNEVELLELEDVQGVVGLKAIRVGVLYNRNSEDNKRLTFKDLLQELHQQ